MTIGISLSNGKEAVVMTDSRGSTLMRKSDSYDKMELFFDDNYHGVFCGTGDANLLLGLNDKLKDIGCDSLDEFVFCIVESAGDVINVSDLQYIYNLKKEITKKMEFLDEDDPYRDDVFVDKLSEALEAYDGRKLDEGNSLFELVAFDKEVGKIRQFLINPYKSEERYLGHLEIGSGSDGSNLYFSTKLQGLDRKNLTMNELLFFSCNGYNVSTVNNGVGGIPKIAQISEENCENFSPHQCIALTNLSGAYLSSHPNLNSVSETLKYIDGIVENDLEIYEILSEKLEISGKNLRTIFIPYSSCQKYFNEKLFNL